MKSKRYSAWVKAQACAACTSRPAGDQHHIIGVGEGIMGGKASDLESFPLCRQHHDELHHDVARWEMIHGGQERHVRQTIRRAFLDGVLVVNRGGN